MRSVISGLALLLVTMPLLAADPPAGGSSAKPGEIPHKLTTEAAVQRGGIVFQHYCALCHGEKADGNGRAARIYNPRPANLLTTDKNDQYKELIIRRGGAALMRSQFMPPWGDELTDEQISDVVAYLKSIQANKP